MFAMKLFIYLAAAITLLFAASAAAAPGPDKDGKYWIRAEGMEAAFVPYGASISNLFINDQYGIRRDVVGGFDNASYYSIDKQHPHLGGVPGRYANRIKNSTFKMDGKTYHVAPNENPTKDAPNGTNTLHGGPDGWDWRNFTVISHTESSIRFMMIDPDGREGFPGDVISHITYSLRDMTWEIKMEAVSITHKTPIMLTSHVYWNLDGFSNNETQTALNHTLFMPYTGYRLGVDGALIPTGRLKTNKRGTANDFWSKPKQLGKGFEQRGIKNNCGHNCVGYDNCHIVNREKVRKLKWRKQGTVARLASAWSGIELEIFSDQQAIQMYSCNGQNGTLALKKTQGLHDNKDFPRTIPKYGCVVLEVHDWIDGINHPEWNRKKRQIFGPADKSYMMQARYKFSVKGREKEIWDIQPFR